MFSALSVTQAQQLIKMSTLFWKRVTIAGLWLFGIYVVLKLFVPSLWLEGEKLITGSNIAMAAHLVFGVIILVAGPLQLFPLIRRRYPEFHRWNGRVFTVVVNFALLSGIYILVSRDIGSIFLKAGFILQALLVMYFSYHMLRSAMAKDFVSHQRWALRMFVVTFSAFFLRILILSWALATGGIGINFDNGTGWFIDFIAIAQFGTLAILEVYFYVKAQGGAKAQVTFSAFAVIFGIITLIGTAMLLISSWYPELAGHYMS